MKRIQIVPALVLGATLFLTGGATAGTLKVPQQFATIQAAVDNAVEGDTIVVSPLPNATNVNPDDPAAYAVQLHGPVIIATKGLALVGKNATIDGHQFATCITVNADDVSISGFRIVNGVFGIRAGAVSTVLGLVVKGNHIEGCTSGGMQLDVDGALVTKNVVTGCQGPGISCTTTDPAALTTISSNDVSGDDADGLDVAGPFVFVSKNTCHRNAEDGLAVVIGANGAGSRIEKNVCELNADSGVHVVNAGAAVSVRSNVVSDNSSNGLLVSGTNLQVASNRAEHNTVAGITVQAGIVLGAGAVSLVTKNHCEANPGSGLRAMSDGEPITVQDNQVLNNGGDGLRGEGQAVQIQQNTATTNGAAGIAIDGAGLVVDSNVCTANSGDGISVDGSDNTIQDNLTQTNARDGIHLAGTGHTIDANHCLGNLSDGIDIHADADDDLADGYVVENNVTDGNGNQGIVNNANDTLITGNEALGNTGPDIAGGGDGGLGGNGSTQLDLATFNATNQFGIGGKGVTASMDL